MDNQEKNGLGDILIAPELVILDLDAATDQEAIDQLAHRLLEQGVVKESYIPAVKQREVDFCTGLDFEAMGVALPHTDSIHVNQQAIGIGVLKHPVTFHAMGMPDETVEVSIMFMLAIQKPDAQVTFLGKMVEVFQEPGCLESVRSAATPQEAAETFRHFFDEAE